MDICPRHGQTEMAVYGKQKKRVCKKCNSEAVRRRRIKLKRMAVEYKGGGCEMCGYSRCLEALEFHHMDPGEKDFSLGGKNQTASWERIKAEIDKCQLVCANCHREIHAAMETEFHRDNAPVA